MNRLTPVFTTLWKRWNLLLWVCYYNGNRKQFCVDCVENHTRKLTRSKRMPLLARNTSDIQHEKLIGSYRTNQPIRAPHGCPWSMSSFLFECQASLACGREFSEVSETGRIKRKRDFKVKTLFLGMRGKLFHSVQRGQNVFFSISQCWHNQK